MFKRFSFPFVNVISKIIAVKKFYSLSETHVYVSRGKKFYFCWRFVCSHIPDHNSLEWLEGFIP